MAPHGITDVPNGSVVQYSDACFNIGVLDMQEAVRNYSSAKLKVPPLFGDVVRDVARRHVQEG